MINRRAFLQSAVAAAAVSNLRAQTPASSEWGGPILDTHFHLRQGPDANAIHMDGCGVTNAILLARSTAMEQVKAIQNKYPGRFVW
ncbi:MAG: hypothetical protein SF339_13135 [Blastocatellia bacterium]|nr:hypothetical protein [Blastocatellia bacterium]